MKHEVTRIVAESMLIGVGNEEMGCHQRIAEKGTYYISAVRTIL